MVFCFSVLCGFTIDKQKIENETKKQTQRDSTIEVLEEQLQLWTAKVSENRMRCLCIATLFTQSPTRWMNESLQWFNLSVILCIVFFLVWQAEQAQQIYIENEKKLEEMLDGIEKLFGFVFLVFILF